MHTTKLRGCITPKLIRWYKNEPLFLKCFVIIYNFTPPVLLVSHLVPSIDGHLKDLDM